MIKWLKNWLLRDEIKTLNECVIKWQQSLNKWRERAQASERDVMEARQVARYWREQAGKGDSFAADDLFPWEVRVMKSYGISVVKRDEALNRATQTEQDASLCRRYEQRQARPR